MKKDIQFRPTEYIGVAVVAPTEAADDFWEVYFFNFQDFAVRNVLINAHGFGEVAGEAVETSTLRYFFDEVTALDFVKVELIDPELFHLNHQYWVSFQGQDGYLYDKKFVFEANTIAQSELIRIPFLDKMGVLVQ